MCSHQVKFRLESLWLFLPSFCIFFFLRIRWNESVLAVPAFRNISLTCSLFLSHYLRDILLFLLILRTGLIRLLALQGVLNLALDGLTTSMPSNNLPERSTFADSFLSPFHVDCLVSWLRSMSEYIACRYEKKKLNGYQQVRYLFP